MNRKPRIWERLGTRLDPHLNNLKYLAKHKWAVLRAGLKLNVPIFRLIVHDWSKLTPIEWFAYTAYFFRKDPIDHNMHVPGRIPTVVVESDSDNYHCRYSTWLVPVGLITEGLINTKADMPLCAISMICVYLCARGMMRTQPISHKEIATVSMPGMIGVAAAITSIVL